MLIYNKIHSLIIIKVLEKILIHTKWTGSVISNIGKPSHAMQARDVNYSQNFSILSRILLQAIFFFFFIAVNRWKRNSLPGTQLFLSSGKREREKEKERKNWRNGEEGGEWPGEKFQTIACASRSGNFERVSRSLCLISFPIIIQLYNSSRELFLDDFQLRH